MSVQNVRAKVIRIFRNMMSYDWCRIKRVGVVPNSVYVTKLRLFSQTVEKSDGLFDYFECREGDSGILQESCDFPYVVCQVCADGCCPGVYRCHQALSLNLYSH